MACPVEVVFDKFGCDTRTGLVYRACKDGPLVVWKPFLTINEEGYIVTYLRWEKKTYYVYAHRVVWAFAHESWPSGLIDHINGNRSDNRIANLRDVPAGANSKNKARYRTNISGVTGVSWCKARRKWRTKITSNYVTTLLGHFEDFDEAVRVRRKAEREKNFHPNHGRKK
jgi:hypothetical protein